QREIDDFVVPICDAITAEGFTYKILKRVKTPYSIWNKMKNKGVDFEEIYDLYAVRIVFDPLPGSTVAEERNQCFQIYSIITSIYSGKEDRFRDWVAHPKSNGYEALHCTLMSNSGIWVEVQIRSRRMDDIAEKGIAAHWSYKRNGIGEGSEMDRWLEKVREVLDNSANVNAMELLEIIHNDLTQTEIIVFTPKGDQVRIAKDATVLDFAFQIHSEIGLSAVAGKVNMKLVPLSTPLSSGDQVEIITAQNQTPNIEWLDFLKTRKARGTVNEWLHEHREDEKPQEKDSVRKESPTVLGNFIHLFGKKKSAPESSPGESYQIADCCKPIPGDFILGFKQSDGSVIVHKKSCPQAGRLATGNGKSLVSVSWKDLTCGESFLVRICIKGVDRMGMLNEISRYISLVMSISMKRLNFIADNGVFEGEIDLFVGDTSDLDKLIRKLSKIEGVKTVSRIEL
ncbi:MAG: TGS domain-containing protein, partial [Bacteroidales bacterium]|nr:TGS domain-containing protein [Bacteroidales bacterium]